jgi:hypothetical protein
VSLALVASPSAGARLTAMLDRFGWQAEEASAGDIWRELDRRGAALVLAQLPWTGWRDFVRQGRKAAREHPGVKLVFMTEVPPPGLSEQQLDGYPATPLMRLSSSPEVLKTAIDAAA